VGGAAAASATKGADRRSVFTDAALGTLTASARSTRRRSIVELPDTAWINRPVQGATQETATSSLEV
jgi:hypothetical protein